MPIQSNEIKIAQKAKESVDALDIDKDFLGFLKGFPSNITQNGLLQTISFIKGKDDPKYKELGKRLETFFQEYFGIRSESLLIHLIDLADIKKYLHYQDTFISFAIWLKRFALAASNEQEHS